MHGTQRAPSQRGFSLIEILVTIVVTAVGLLGFAGLQAYSIKNNRIAMQHSLATVYANNIIDCMRANRAAVGNYTLSTFTDAHSRDGTVAADDVADWLNAIKNNLPAGQARLTFATGVYTIEIRWSESLSSDDAATHTFKTETSI